MKLYVTKGAAVDREMLSMFEIVEGGAKECGAKAAIAWNIPIDVPFDKTVLLQSEPPVAIDRLKLYPVHNSFLLAGTYLGGFPLTDTPAYPYRPAYGLWQGREARPRRGTGIYFAGKKGRYTDGWNFEGFRQYGLRAQIAKKLQAELGGVILGRGWPQSTKGGDWHWNKRRDVDEIDPDYVLGVENCYMPNYVSEKFWDAMLSQRLALILGAPTLPEGSYVDLNQWVSADRKIFNAKACADFLRNMSEEEYLDRIKKQTEYAYRYKGDWERRRDEVTKICIERLSHV